MELCSDLIEEILTKKYKENTYNFKIVSANDLLTITLFEDEENFIIWENTFGEEYTKSLEKEFQLLFIENFSEFVIFLIECIKKVFFEIFSLRKINLLL